MNFFKNKKYNLLLKINNNNKVKRYIFLIFGIFLSALSFNMFFLPIKLVVGGISGISIIIDELFNINPNIVIYVINIILIIISFIVLGKKQSIKNIT